MEYMDSYQSLFVWKKSIELVRKTYRIIGRMPTEERFNLTDQLRRAATSIPANIAEGSSKHTIKERRRYINMAYSSAQELENHLIVTHECSMMHDVDFNDVSKTMRDVLRLLNCYYKNPMAKKRN